VCGIAGAIGGEGRHVVEEMAHALRHRGPDGEGFHAANGLHMGAVRLAVIDLEAPPQPVYGEGRRISAIFNGEIYNHAELRRELRRKGHCFRSETDTEVIVHLFEEYGEGFVHHLSGMFAIAITDGQQLVLARDRFGIKPLFYAVDDERGLFLFASEVKALLPHRRVRPSVDLEALADWLVLGHLVGSETFFEGVRVLQSGHILTLSWAEKPWVIRGPYAYIDCARDPDAAIGLSDAVDELEAALLEAVASHMCADVEVGLTLSGGLDSTMLALMANDVGEGPLRTFTVADHLGHADLRQAEVVAGLIESAHTSTIVTFKEYVDRIPALVRCEEAPSSLLALPFYALCDRVGTQVKACLNGEGADELLGGYGEYLDPNRKLGPIRNGLIALQGQGLNPSAEALNVIGRLAAAVSSSKYVESVLDFNLSDPLERQHLDVVDKCAMAFGVEMRVPFVADNVQAVVGRFPAKLLVREDLRVSKYVMKHLAVRRYSHRYGAAILDVVLRGKLGAPASGLRLLSKFDRLCEETLPDSYLIGNDLGLGVSLGLTSKRKLLLLDYFHELFMHAAGDVERVGPVTTFMMERAGQYS
jgi:asparagine synthase (glutamine-hydrolysing)